MSTINNTDVFLIVRGTTNYKVTAADVASYSVLGGLPSQAGNSGKVLSTNGSGVLSWIVTGGTGTVTSVTGTLPITVATGTSTPVIAINAATTAATGSIQLATAAENAAGTDATKAVTPAFSVPKDASGMTGAALIPGGNDAARPTTPATGMTRYNSQSGTPVSMEYYDGAAWSGFGGGGSGSVQVWVNFNGTTIAPTIMASGNVSSITRNGTGDYTVNFITAQANSNYTIYGTGGNLGSTVSITSYRATAPTTGSCRMGSYNYTTNVLEDQAITSFCVIS